jgi:SAM-dependent methyltransferase
MNETSWPKVLPELTDEQRRISDDFMKYWHEVLPRNYGIIEHFNHTYPVRHAPPGFRRTLELGAGLGEHLVYEKLTPEQEANYVALDIRENMVARLKERFPRITAIVGDCQARLPFPDGHFDRIVVVHLLEHLPNLPAAVREMHRLCDMHTGQVSVIMPCEGGLSYDIARRISAQRIFEKRYKQPYRWFIEREHLNKPFEIIPMLEKYFLIMHRAFFPLGIPSVTLNLCIGMTLRPRIDRRIYRTDLR